MMTNNNNNQSNNYNEVLCACLKREAELRSELPMRDECAAFEAGDLRCLPAMEWLATQGKKYEEGLVSYIADARDEFVSTTANKILNKRVYAHLLLKARDGIDDNLAKKLKSTKFMLQLLEARMNIATGEMMFYHALQVGCVKFAKIIKKGLRAHNYDYIELAEGFSEDGSRLIMAEEVEGEETSNHTKQGAYLETCKSAKLAVEGYDYLVKFTDEFYAPRAKLLSRPTMTEEQFRDGERHPMWNLSYEEVNEQVCSIAEDHERRRAEVTMMRG